MGTDTQENNKPLYDFIYIDKNRLYSLVSQLTDKGLLTQQIINDGSIAKTSEMHNSQGQVEGGAGLSNLIKVAGKTSHSYTNTGVQETVETIQHYFNTEHTAPIFLVEHIINSGLAKESLDSNYGDLIFVSGVMSIRDMGLLQGMYSSISGLIKDQFEDMNNEEFDKIMGLVKSLPHMITLSICTNTGETWSSLEKEYFLINHLDLIAKHNIFISGNWKCLAILDKKPNEKMDQKISNKVSPIETLFTEGIPYIREMMGIQECNYGISPIAIFRNLNVIGR